MGVRGIHSHASQNRAHQHFITSRNQQRLLTHSFFLSLSSARSLKQGVAGNEGRENPAHLLIGHPICRHHLPRGHGDVDAIDIGHDADEKQQGEDEPAYPRGARSQCLHKVGLCGLSIEIPVPDYTDSRRGSLLAGRGGSGQVPSLLAERAR